MNWQKKLTSRKFWMALAALVVGVLALFKVDANMTTQISGVVMSLGAVIAYIVGEGLVDAAAVGTEPVSLTASGNVVAKVAGDVATAAQTVKMVAEDVTKPVAEATQPTNGADVKVTDDTAKATGMVPETSESASKAVIG